MLKFLREGAKRLGAATTPGAKRGGTKKGGGSKYYKRDKDTGQVKSLSEKKLTRRGAGVAAAGAATGVTGAAAASKGDKPKAKAKTSRRGPSMKEAGANIKKSKEAFERRRRSNRQAESAMRSVQKSRALGEAAARDPKATKPPKPEAPPTASVKQEREKAPKTRVAVEKPKAPKVEVKPNVVPRVYATPKSNRKLVEKEKAEKRSAPKSESKAKNFNVGVSKGGVSFKEAFRHFRNKGAKTFTWNGKKYTTELAKKMGGGMMKSKMASKGGARGGKKMMMPGGMKAGGSASKFPDLTGDGQVTQADILKGRGVTKKRNGGMMKSKGMAKGGAMKKKGYSKGGAVSRKPRGVGAAKRGYGKAMR